MTDESKTVLRSGKYARIISEMSDTYGVSLREATDIFYRSETAMLIDEGVADLHCRSDKYLATLIWEEHCENTVECD